MLHILISDFSLKMASTKGHCEDLTEGKFSLPVIHAIRSSSARNNEILNILKLRTMDPMLKSYALQYMSTQTESLEYTRNVLNYLHGKAQTAMEAIGGKNEAMEMILVKLDLY